jgi:hypothetical protein
MTATSFTIRFVGVSDFRRLPFCLGTYEPLSVYVHIPLCINGRWRAGSVLLAALQQALDQCGGFIAELLAHQLERIFPSSVV